VFENKLLDVLLIFLSYCRLIKVFIRKSQLTVLLHLSGSCHFECYEILNIKTPILHSTSSELVFKSHCTGRSQGLLLPKSRRFPHNYSKLYLKWNIHENAPRSLKIKREHYKVETRGLRGSKWVCYLESFPLESRDSFTDKGDLSYSCVNHYCAGKAFPLFSRLFQVFYSFFKRLSIKN
jgi:hypothetical protein